MTLPPDSTVLSRFLLELIISATSGFTAFKELYHQSHLKIMGGSLIVNLIFLGQCGLKALSFYPC